MNSIHPIGCTGVVKLPYPNQWKKLEKRYGEPMETLLPRKANELGSLKAVAQEFEVRYETIWKWGKRIELARICEFRAPAGK